MRLSDQEKELLERLEDGEFDGQVGDEYAQDYSAEYR